MRHTLLHLDARRTYRLEMMRQMSRLRPSDGHAGRDGRISLTGVSTPMTRLEDQTYTKIILLTLAENTSVLEASKLQDDRRRAKIEPNACVINSSLSATATTDPLLRARAAGEGAMNEDVENRRAVRTFIVPWQAKPPVGAASMHELIWIATK